MCDLKAAEICHAAVEPHLDKLAQKYPGKALVAYLDGDLVRVKLVSSFKAGEKFRTEELSEQERATSILVELPEVDRVLML